MRVLILVSIASIIFSSCAGKKIDRRKSKLHTKIGTTNLQNNEIPQAFRNLFLAVQYDPSNAIAHNNLALAYYARKKFPEALKHFDAALDKKENYTDAKNNKGRLLIDMGKYSEAISLLEQASKDLTFPVPEKILTNLSMAYFKNNNWEQSEKFSKQAIELNRKFCPPYVFYGRSLYEQKKYSNSAKVLDQTLEICSKNNYVSVFYFSGMSHFKLGNLSIANARMTEIVSKYKKSKYAKEAQELIKIME